MKSNTSQNSNFRYLTYHELERGTTRDLYRVECAQFETQLVMLRELNLHYTEYHVTFDDGHISNVDLALPVLEKYGMRSIFFITTEWMGEKNRLSEQHIRELFGRGHQVESHSCSHAFLTECSDTQLHSELLHSRERLEDVLGAAVTAVSIPYGRWDRRVLLACARAGYCNVYTSDPWLSTAVRDGVKVRGRLTVRNTMDPKRLRHLLTAKGLAKARLQMPFKMKQALRVCIGDHMYHRVWRAFAERTDSVGSTSYEHR